MQVIGAGYSACRRSGIPVREPPKNICDVNPWVCRMNPIDISQIQSRQPPNVARMTFEPHPRGCSCCYQRFNPPKLSDEESPVRSFDNKKKKWSLRGKKKSKSTKSIVNQVGSNVLGAELDAAMSKWTQKLDEKKMVRLLRENKRREDFVTECCQGLLRSPCASVDSDCALNDHKEQANFFIKANCTPTGQECGTVKTCKSVTHFKKHRADFPCQCRTCKYVTQVGGPTMGCGTFNIEEKTVCYCTDEEKCETDAEPKLTSCGEYQMPGVCQTRTTIVDNGRADCCVQPGGKVLFTAALAQEMLIQLARNGVDMANCIPTKNQYLIDCQKSPCAPYTQCLPDLACRVDNNCVQLRSYANNPDCITTDHCNDVLECRKVEEIDCQPDLRCNVSPCAPDTQCLPDLACRVYNNGVKFRSYANNPDRITTNHCNDALECRKVGGIDCQPDLRYNVYNCQGPQYSRVKCRVMPDCMKVYDVDCDPCSHRVGYLSGFNPCGHICIPKGAVPGCAGDMYRSRQWSSARERPSTFQENMYRYSSSRKTSEPRERPSRLSDERTSELMRSSEAPDTKRPSELSTMTTNPWAYCGPGLETDGEVCKEERKKKNKKTDKSKNEPSDSGKKRSTKQSDSTKRNKERSRSRSPSPQKQGKYKVEQLTKVKSSRPSIPPHFDDIEASSKPLVTANSGYEADLVETMERVKRRYLDRNNDTTGSSSRATTTTDQCKTPTIKEFMGLTEQIKCLRKELRKYCKSDCE